MRIMSRQSAILPEFIGYRFDVHNGKKFFPIQIKDNMVATTRTHSNRTHTTQAQQRTHTDRYAHVRLCALVGGQEVWRVCSDAHISQAP